MSRADQQIFVQKTNYIVTSQPTSVNIAPPSGEWNSEIFGCCDECSTCYQATCCPSKLQKLVAEDIGRAAFNRSGRCLKCPFVCF